MKSILTLALCICALGIYGQKLQYRKYQHTWDAAPVSIALNDEYKNRDAVVLKEDYNYTIYEAQYKTVISKKLRIKYLTQEGINKYSQFVLPECDDPVSEYYDVGPGRKPYVHRPKYYDMEVVYFAARVIKPDGSIVPAVITDKPEMEPFVAGMDPLKAFSYCFTVSNLSAGDEIEVAYEVLMRERLFNNRIFFAGALPKQQFRFTMKWSSEQYLVFNNFNGYAPETVNDKTFTTSTWSATNIPGCINEPGARLHRNVPGTSYYISNGMYWQESATGKKEKLVPYSWAYVVIKFMGYYDYWNGNAVREGWMNRTEINTSAVKDFYKTHLTGLTDTSGYAKLVRLVTAVNDLKYLNDSAYVADGDQSLGALGAHLNDNELRWRGRFKLYSRLFDLTGRPYYFVHNVDKRVADFDLEKAYPFSDYFEKDNYFTSPTSKQMALVIDKIPYYIYPKDHQFGLEVNELPFYLEDVSSLLVSGKAYQYDPENIRFINTPKSTIADNTRKTMVMANVNTATGKIDFDAKITLSGQFSTLTRGFYSHNYVDSTINPRYFTKVNEISAASKLIKHEVVSHLQVFPYTTQLKTQYSVTDVIKVDGDEMTIGLNNWFRYIIYENFSAKDRFTDFYPDFQFQDTYRYFLKFDQPVKLLNGETMTVNIQNDFGKFTVSVSQSKPDFIQLETDFQVSAEMVGPRGTMGVEAIYKAIKALEGKELKVKTGE